jgi:acetyltransferase
MSTYRLDRVFSPCSVALIGASPREKSVGRAVLKNLRDGGWSGPLHVINPKHRDIDVSQPWQTSPNSRHPPIW